MYHNILILRSNSQNNPDYYDTLVPLCIKILSKKNIYSWYTVTPTVLGLLTWDLVPRLKITFYLDYLNDHSSPTLVATCDTSNLGFWIQLCRYTRKGLFYPIVEKNHKLHFWDFISDVLHPFTHKLLDVQYRIATMNQLKRFLH